MLFSSTLMNISAAAILILAAGPELAKAENCSLGVFTMPVTMEAMRASVPVEVNGKMTSFWLDSGAWFSIMPQAKAIELGLRLDPAPANLSMTGIGGSFIPQVTRIKDFAVAGSMLHNVNFLVGGSDAGNGLIGRNMLANGDLELDLPHGIVKLITAKHCENSNMAYWAAGKPYFTVRLLPNKDDTSVHSLGFPVLLNGHEVKAVIDTGAITIVSRSAAERAGIDLSEAGAMPGGKLGGFGRRLVNGWRVRFDSVAIGAETILHAPLTVIDGPILAGPGSPDMIIGADYLLAHHMYVSRAQNLIFFTYTGGDPFLKFDIDAKLPASHAPSQLPAGTVRISGLDQAAEPRDASEFARRGAARLARNDASGAISDFNEAIRLDPADAENYRRRGDANLASGNMSAFLADYEHALKLAPNDPNLILARAWQQRNAGHDSDALADAKLARGFIPPGSLNAAQIAELYNELGQAVDAVAIYDAIIAAHPEDSQLGSLLNGRCWSRALANVELDKALSDCNRALKLSGKSAAMLDSRALVEFRQRKFQQALADYDEALTLDSNLSWSHYMRGQVRIALGDAGDGKSERDSALASAPRIIDRARHYGLDGSLGPQ